MNNYKGDYMTNLKKLGLTALAGSLAAVSAQAGEMSVSGGINLTYTTGDSGANSAQSLGNDKDVAFSGSGELDNGWTFSSAVTMTDAFDVSSSVVTMTMGSMGSLSVGTGNGAGIHGAYDETYPRAYEENSDAGGQSASNYIGNWADNNALVYRAPAIDLMGATVNIGAEYSLQADGDTTNDGGAIARSNTYGNATSLGVTVNYDALTLGAYGATRENKNPNTVAGVSDEFNGTWFANYSFGPVAIGYQEIYVDAGLAETDNAATTTSAKTVGTSSGVFDGSSMSIAFNVNDDLSISYAETEETFDSQEMNGSAQANHDVEQSSESLQIAYSMGAMSIKAYSTEITNPNYDSDAAKLNINEIALGLAF
jgi:outer membrane protein OmpU